MIYDTEMGKTELYRHFIDIGAAAVIAMHTHCPQGYEIYNGAPIVYSKGVAVRDNSPKTAPFCGLMRQKPTVRVSVTVGFFLLYL